MRRLALCVALACACGDDGAGDQADAGADAAVDPPHVVFLSFEGESLSPGADDPVTNTTPVLTSAQTATPFLDDQTDRDTRIGNVVASVELAFAPFNVDVVTTRPAAGPYDMVVLTGAADELGFPTGIGAVASSDCNDRIDGNILLIFGDTFAATGDEASATLAIAGVGLAHGIPSSSQVDDCMCFSAAGCPGTNRCSVGGANTPIAAGDMCAEGLTTMDEQGRFGTTYGLRR